MTQRQIELITNSISHIVVQSDEIGMEFYRRLFEEHPQTLSMFKTEIQEQSKKLMELLITAVKSIDRLESLDLSGLGKKHETYGVKPEHYVVVKKIFLDLFEEKLGPDYDSETKGAWNDLFDDLSKSMLDGTVQT